MTALKSALGAQLDVRAFQRKASTWYRQAEGGLQVVNLQKSAFGGQFYVNLACVPVGMVVEGMPTPKEYQCPVRIRLGAAFPESDKKIGEVFNLDHEGLTDVERCEEVCRLSTGLILPFLEHMRNAESLRRAIDAGLFTRGAVTLAARKHLGVFEKHSQQPKSS